MDDQNNKPKREKQPLPAVVVPMDPELKARLVRAAKTLDRSQASLLRCAVVEYMDRLGI